MKNCFGCNKPKTLGEFYTHPAMKDGHLNKCKECIKADATNHRNANIETARAYDRERSKRPGELERRRIADRNMPPEKAKAYRLKWEAKNAEKIKAHSQVRDAIIKGDLIRQSCERCGTNENVHAHHDDYSKPLEVKWLCPIHHGERHRELNELKRLSN